MPLSERSWYGLLRECLLTPRNVGIAQVFLFIHEEKKTGNKPGSSGIISTLHLQDLHQAIFPEYCPLS